MFRFVVIACATIALGAVAGGCTDPVQRDAETGEVLSAVENGDVFALQVGDCFDYPDAEEVMSLPIVPCSEPHDAEAFHAFDLPEGEYPGQEAVNAAVETCIGSPWTAHIGLAYQDSLLELAPLSPTAESWAQGDREVLCAVTDPAGQVTGSLEAARR